MNPVLDASTRPSAIIHRPLRPVVLLLSALLLALGAAGMAGADGLTKAQTAWEKGDQRAAVVHLKDHLQRDPGDPAARLLLGRIALETGDPRAAQQEVERAQAAGAPPTEAVPLLAEAMLNQGRFADVLALILPADAPATARAALLATQGQAELGRNDLEAASALFDQALALAPDPNQAQPQAALGQALVLAGRGDLEAARAAIVDLTARHPASSLVWQTLGNLDYAAGRADDAIAAYSEAIAHAQVTWPLHFRRGLAHAEAGDLDATKADLAALQAQSPGYPGAQYLRGWIALREGEPATATEALEAYLKVAPEDPRGVYFAALALYQTDRHAQAEEYLVRLYNRLPENAMVATLLALTRLERNDARGAEAVVAPIAASGDSTPASLEALRRALLAQGRNDEAGAVLEELAARFPGSTGAQLMLAQQRQQRGELASAESILEAVLAREPGRADATQLLIRGQLQAGRTDAALRAAQGLLERDPDAALSHTIHAAVLAARGDLDGARDAFHAALERDPGFTRAAVGLAALELGDARAGDARQTLDELLAADPANTMGWLALAGLDAREGGAGASMTRLREAVAANPGDLSLRLAAARALVQDAQPEAALTLLQQAPADQRDRPGLMLLRAQAELDAGLAPAALITLQRFAKLNPDSPQARFMMAAVQARVGDPRSAEAQLTEGLRLDRNQVLAPLHLNSVLAALPDDAARTSLLDRLLLVAPAHPRLLAARGALALQTGDLAGALKRFETVRRDHPDRADGLLGLADTLHALGRSDEATAELAEWLDAHPQDLAARLLQAQIALARNRADEAIPHYRAVLEVDDDNAVALNNLAMLIAESKPDEALALAERGAALRPQDPAYLDTLGFVLLELGQTERAREVLAKAHAATPDPSIAYRYATALAAIGDAAQARSVLRPIVARQFPEQAAANELLERLVNR